MYFLTLFPDTNYKSKQGSRKYENRQNPIIFGKKWPNQGDKMRIIAIQLSKERLFLLYQNYFPSPFQPGLSDIRKNIFIISGLYFIDIQAWFI